MKKLFWLLPLFFLTFELSAENLKDYSGLIEHALKARSKAYAPYSRYLVGAALKTASGKIFSGCNVENASYGLTICAERSAVFSAIATGSRDLTAIVVATKDGGAPCGACRQVLNEFNPEMTVILIDEAGAIKNCFKLNELLPTAFGPKNLEKQKL
ncbi:MAG: cytidine deaminase [Parachlamydiales bacterium]|jgi:cytidine deaminase